jgi:O-glycosyl hydrolase
LTGIEHVAFENPDGQKVLIVTNPGEGKSVTVSQAGKTAELSMAQNSIATLLWS